MMSLTSLYAAGWIVCRLDRLTDYSWSYIDPSTFVDKRAEGAAGWIARRCRVVRMQILKTIDCDTCTHTPFA